MVTGVENESGGRRRIPWCGLVLASVLLNAFLLGVMIGHGGGSRPPFPEGRFGHGDPLMRLERALDKVDSPAREKIQALIDQKKTAIRDNMDKMLDTMPEMDAILAAPRFDPAQLEAENTKIEGYDHALKTDMMVLMTQIAKTLPDGQRIEFFSEISPRGAEHGPPPGGP